MKVFAADGIDGNGDGVADWLIGRMSRENGFVIAPAESKVSPVCLEGTARFPSLVTLSSGGQPVSLNDGLQSRWYADAPLDPTGEATPVTAGFEGVVQRQHTVTWTQTNVLAAGTITLRVGDSLRLTAYSGEAAVPGDTATLQLPGGQTRTIDPSVPLAWTFSTAGDFTLTATSQDANGAVTSGSMLVKVRQADFGAAFPVYVNRPRLWSLPGIPAGLLLDPDPAIAFAENAPANGVRVVSVSPMDATSRHVLARLASNGPIAARGTIAALDVASTTTTSDTEVVHTYDNGDRIVRMSVVADNLPSGGYVKLVIFVSGVTFTDGTLTKILTAADFDANGVGYVYFNYPEGQPTSVCHRLYVYDARNNLIGTR